MREVLDVTGQAALFDVPEPTDAPKPVWSGPLPTRPRDTPDWRAAHSEISCAAHVLDPTEVHDSLGRRDTTADRFLATAAALLAGQWTPTQLRAVVDRVRADHPDTHYHVVTEHVITHLKETT